MHTKEKRRMNTYRVFGTLLSLPLLTTYISDSPHTAVGCAKWTSTGTKPD